MNDAVRNLRNVPGGRVLPAANARAVVRGVRGEGGVERVRSRLQGVRVAGMRRADAFDPVEPGRLRRGVVQRLASDAAAVLAEPAGV